MIYNNIQYLLTFNYWGPDFGNLRATGSYSYECWAVSSSSQWFFLNVMFYMQTCTSYHSSILIFRRISNEQFYQMLKMFPKMICESFCRKEKSLTAVITPQGFTDCFIFKDYELCTTAGHKLDILFMWFV